MAKFFEINGKTATQSAHMAYTAYKSAQALVTAHNGVIDFVDGKNIKATFKSNKSAKAFVTAFESAYAEAHKAYKSAKADLAWLEKGNTEGVKLFTKKATPSSTKKTAPKKAKGNAFNFDEVKGATKSEKNRALHAMLVGKGITNSKSDEYMSVWNARPWAK